MLISNKLSKISKIKDTQNAVGLAIGVGNGSATTQQTVNCVITNDDGTVVSSESLLGLVMTKYDNTVDVVWVQLLGQIQLQRSKLNKYLY